MPPARTASSASLSRTPASAAGPRDLLRLLKSKLTDNTRSGFTAGPMTKLFESSFQPQLKRRVSARTRTDCETRCFSLLCHKGPVVTKNSQTCVINSFREPQKIHVLNPSVRACSSGSRRSLSNHGNQGTAAHCVNCPGSNKQKLLHRLFYSRNRA